nr:S41 family peptidase [uncultured Cellulosilyticum sp.]
MRHIRIDGKKLVIAVGLVGVLAGCNLIQGSQGATFTKLKFLSRQVSKLYLGDLDQKELNEGVFTGYVDGLENPVSTYLDETAYKQHLAYEEGKTIGTGLTYSWGLDGNHLVITEVVPNSPADKMGVKVGDQIVKVDDIKVIYSNESALAKALGEAEEGSSNTYVIRKKTDSTTAKPEEKTIKIKKELIEKPSLKVDTINNIGYLKLQNIKTGTSEEVDKALADFGNKKINKVVLDIRDLYSNNLDETLKICDLLMDKALAFKIENKEGKMQEYYTADGKTDEKVVILMNNSTAGMIEALPAAVKGEIPLVGTHSAGSGYLSEVFSLDDGTGLRLATGILYTKEGIAVNKDGIAVDEEAFQSVQSVIELLGEGTMSYASDMQLQAAINQLNK